MNRIDMRSLSPADRHRRRVRVLALREAGSSFAAIASQTGLSRTGVFGICKRLQQKALRRSTTRRKRGAAPALAKPGALCFVG